MPKLDLRGKFPRTAKALVSWMQKMKIHGG